MRKQQLVLLTLLSGCTQPTVPTPRGLAVDGTHLRMGVADLASTPTVDPRLILAQLSWQLSGVSAARYQPAAVPAPTAPVGETFAQVAWTQGANAAISATAGLWIPNYPNQDNVNDRLYTVAMVGTGWQARIYNQLYNAAPTLCASATLDGDVDNGFVAVSADGQTFYVGTTRGTLYAIGNPATCTGGSITPSWSYASGSTFSRTGPWIDYGSGALYIGAANGVHAVDKNGNPLIGFPVNVGGAVHNLPIVWNGNVWVGTDAGAIVRIDGSSGAVRSTTSLCAGACGINDAIYATPFVDTARNVLITAANGRVFEIDGTCASTSSTCAPAVTSFAFSTTAGQVWSSPTVDAANGWLYLGFDNKLFKISYPIAGGTAISAATFGIGANPTYPRSTPLVFGGYAFLGDGGGYLDRVATSSAASIGTVANTTSMGSSVDSTCVIDYMTGGNVYVGSIGSPGGATAGAMMQVVRAF